MNTIIKINGYLRSVEEAIQVTAVGAMAVALIANVFFRYVLQNSLNFIEEGGMMLLITVTYLGSSYAVRDCKHIRMSAILDKMSEKFAKRWSIVIDSFTGVVFIYIGYLMFDYMLMVKQMGSVTAALQMPRWIVVLPIVIGMVFSGLQYLLLVAMNCWDKDNFWIGTEKKYQIDGTQNKESIQEGGDSL